MKSNSVMSKSVVGTVISWTFKDGKTASIDVSKLNDTIRNQAMLHGITQKVADAAAMKVDPTSGKPANVADKRAAMEKVITTLVGGEWRGEREGGDSVLLQALAIVYPKRDHAFLVEFIKGKSAAERITLANSPKVKAEIDKFTAVKLKAANVNVKTLTDELENIK